MTRSNRSHDGRIVCRQAIPSPCGGFTAASDRHRRIESTEPRTGAAERWLRLRPTVNFEPSDTAAAATRLDLLTKTAWLLLQNGEHKESKKSVGYIPSRVPISAAAKHMLSLSALRRITVFSLADQVLVKRHLEWAAMEKELTVGIELKDGQPRYPMYTQSQKDGPGREFLRLTCELYKAIWEKDRERQAILLTQLSNTCFD